MAVTDYYLKGIDLALWKKAQRKARDEGHTMKWLFLKWLTEYVGSVAR